MRTARSILLMRIASVLLVALVWGCGDDAVPDPPVETAEGLGSVAPEAGTDPVTPDPLDGEGFQITEPAGLGTIMADTVQGWRGPGGRSFEVARRTPGRTMHLSRRIGQATFPLAARLGAGALSQYPCSACHEGELAMGDRIEDAHADIQATHPEAAGTTCTFCHVADSVELLALHDASTTTLDHAYRLCAQCHVSETRDWAAGVHGKRLEGWYGRRIVMNCADCHDPHRPGLEPRIPYPGPSLIRGGSP